MIREYKRRLRVNRMRDAQAPVLLPAAFIILALHVLPIGVYLGWAIINQ